MSLFSRLQKRRIRTLKIRSKEFILGQKKQKIVDEQYFKDKVSLLGEHHKKEILIYKTEISKIKTSFNNEKSEIQYNHKIRIKELGVQHRKELADRDEEVSRIYREYNDKKKRLDSEYENKKNDLQEEYDKKENKFKERQIFLERLIERWDQEVANLDDYANDLQHIQQLVDAHATSLIKAAVKLSGPDKDEIIRVKSSLRNNHKKVLRSGPKRIRIGNGNV